MGKKVEHAAKIAVAKIAKKYNITDKDRLINLMTKIVIDDKGARFDKGGDDKNFLGLLFMPFLEEAFLFLPPDKALDLFENSNLIDLVIKAQILKYYLDEQNPFYTHKELLDLTKRFTKYLHDNRASLVSMGYPAKRFESSPWFYRKLACLYPVNTWVWIQNRDSRHQASSGIDSETEKRTAAPLIGGLTDNDIEQIQEQRAKLFNLKTNTMKIACKYISNKITGKKDCVHFYSDCMNAMCDKLFMKDFQFLNTIEEKYTKFFSSHQSSDSSSTPATSSITCIGKDMEVGGLKNIFEFIFFVEKELTIGRMHKTKTRIMPLVANQTPASYYQLVPSSKIADIDRIIFKSLGYDKKEAEFHKMCYERLKDDIGKKLKAPLAVCPERYDLIKVFAQFVETTSGAGIDVRGYFTRLLTQKKEIHPVNLPANTRWEHITIQFLDAHTVRITAPNFHATVDYKQMGFENNRKYLPNMQWELLRLLAQQRGELTWRDPRASTRNKKKKQLLADTLKTYFQIDEDPFLPYRQHKAYKIRINLIPE